MNINKIYHLSRYEVVRSLLNAEYQKGNKKLLELGTSSGDLAYQLKNDGFDVVGTGLELDSKKFKYHDTIKFITADLDKEFPFEKASFDIIIGLEITEHLENVQGFVRMLSYTLRDNGVLILSTPNILNILSRLRFLFEGSYNFFKEPPLDVEKNPKVSPESMHIYPVRFHELELFLYRNNMLVEQIATCDTKRYLKLNPFLLMLRLLSYCQMSAKAFRSKRKGGYDYYHLRNLLLSDELFFGKHLIVKARKTQGITSLNPEDS